jgi:translation initiation factor 4G
LTFGTTDDVSAVSAPISSSPATTPAIKSEGVKSFGSVPANTGHVNGKPSISSPASSVAPSKPSAPTASASSSTATTPAKVGKFDVRSLFQNPSSSPPSNPPPEASSPSVRTSGLPQQSQHQQQQPSSSHHQQGQLPTSSQPSQLGASSYTFVPSGNFRPQQPNSGPGGGPGAGSRSSGYAPRPMTNGAGARPPVGPNGPGGPPPQMTPGLPNSPRLTPHSHPGQQSGMPLPQEVPISPYPTYYVSVFSLS